MDKPPDACGIFWRAIGDSFDGYQYADQCRYTPP
jgi:hypothetical protein